MIMKNKSVKIGRNDLCPCGSGIKYKNCCRNLKMEINIKEEYKRRYDIHLKEPNEIEGIRKSGELLMSILNQVELMIQPGLKTDDINTFVGVRHNYFFVSSWFISCFSR